MFSPLIGAALYSFSTELQIQEACKLIVNILPTFPWHSEAFSSAFLQTESWNIKDGNDHIKELLLGKCISRYHEILDQHTRNIMIITNKSIEYREDPLKFTSANISKPTLHILDLEETILDGKFKKNGPHMHIEQNKDWRRLCAETNVQNARDLNFGLHSGFDREEKQFGYLVLFRQYLMHYIDRHRQSADIIIYSLSDIHQIIPHVILIEMYYNFVYQFAINSRKFTSNRTKLQMFKFEYVIGRLRDSKKKWLTEKSFTAVIKLIGDIRCYASIFIVDDGGKKQWINKIPSGLIANTNRGWFKGKGRKLFALEAPRFDIFAKGSWNLEKFMKRSVKQKLEDKYFAALSNFVSRSHNIRIQPVNNTLKWIDLEMMLEAIVQNDKKGDVEL